MTIGPRDLPEIRSHLLDYYADYSYRHPAGRQRMHGDWLQAAELYYVTAPMCALTMSAAKTLPKIELDPSDVDAPHCLMWFEHSPLPFGPSNYHLMLVSVDSAALHVNLWLPRQEYLQFVRECGEQLKDVDENAPSPDELEDLPNIPFFACHGVSLPWGIDVAGDPDSIHATRVGAFVVSAMLLMRQNLAVRNEVVAPRAAARRIAREGRKPGSVRVISLRSARGESSGDVAAQREWSHQWIVRGHWRQQPHGPGREQRRPVWIAPHVKGPEGAPLLGGEKVYAWRQ